MKTLLTTPKTLPLVVSVPPQSDEQLMLMVQKHLRGGIDQLHDRYAGILRGLGMSVLRNEADVEDLIQDVFVEVWNHAANYDPLKGKPLSWIATLTRRRAIDRLRKRERCSRLEEHVAQDSATKTEGWSHVHEEIALSEIHTILQHAMFQLPDAQRSALELAYASQMTQREIATHTGIPLGTIKTRLELGLRKMAVALQGFEGLLWPERQNARSEKT